MRRVDYIMFQKLTEPPQGIGERRKRDYSYSFAWLAQVEDVPLRVKTGVGVLFALWSDSYHSFFTRVFAVALSLWAVDIVAGTVRALVDPKVVFRWSKMVDGMLRMLIICAIAFATAAAGEAILELSGVDIRGQLLGFVYGAIIVAEFSSLIVNVSYFYPSLSGLAERISPFLSKKGLPNVEEKKGYAESSGND